MSCWHWELCLTKHRREMFACFRGWFNVSFFFFTFSISPILIIIRSFPPVMTNSNLSPKWSLFVLKSNPARLVVRNLMAKSSDWVSVSSGIVTVMYWVPLKVRVDASFPQIGPVKLVPVQSQMNLFQPSEHTPLFIHGCESHWVGCTWQDGRIAAEKKENCILQALKVAN